VADLLLLAVNRTWNMVGLPGLSASGGTVNTTV
jgi:hypothetical protein